MSNMEIKYKSSCPIDSVWWETELDARTLSCSVTVSDNGYVHVDDDDGAVLIPLDIAEDVLEACLRMVREAKGAR